MGGISLFKWYDVKCGIMGFIPRLNRWLLFPTENEYEEYYNENESEHDIDND